MFFLIRGIDDSRGEGATLLQIKINSSPSPVIWRIQDLMTHASDRFTTSLRVVFATPCTFLQTVFSKPYPLSYPYHIQNHRIQSAAI